MASKTLLELTTDTPATTDLLYYVKNPGGTPLDRAVTLTALKGAVAPTLNEHQIGFGSASNFLTGAAGFTFDPAAGTGTFLLINPSSTAANSIGTYVGLNLLGAASGTPQALEVTPYVDAGVTLTSLINIAVVPYIDPMATVTTHYGIRMEDIIGAGTNIAIQTAAGDIVFGTLAGTGSRPVVADANGKLSAL